MSKSTLSSVVSTLVRASMGTSLPTTVGDEDLDKHVADIILREAKQKADNYDKLGIKAYLPPGGPDPNAPRPNKRFLSSIIRSTDDHNKTILRAQALAAQEIKREREEQERRERKARAEEAAAAERSRRRKRRDDYDSDGWDTRWSRDGERSRPRLRAWDSDWKNLKRDSSEDELERERGHKRSRRGHRSRSDSRDCERERDRKHRSGRKRTPSQERDRDKQSRRSGHSRRRHRLHESRDDNVKHRRQKDHSPDRKPNQIIASHKRSRSPSLSEDHGTPGKKQARDCPPCFTPSRSSQTPTVESGKEGTDSKFCHVSKGKERDTDDVSFPMSPLRIRSPSPPPPPPPRRQRGRPVSSTSVRSPSVSPPPLPPAALPSKMDKYFEDSYDPRLDVNSLSVPTVPKTGLINDSEYEAWDAMLELLRQRREDKEEKKRLEKLGFNMSDKKIPTPKLKKYSEGGDSIMEIEYKKKGSVREWDLGKEGF